MGGSVAAAIDEWWPLLNEQIRFWVVNNVFSPLAPYTLQEIERAGGPSPDDPYWKRDGDGGRCLPQDGLRWVMRSPDFATMSRPKEPNPRAAYFRRTWPRR